MRQTSVGRQQRLAESLGRRDVQRVVERHVVAQRPGTIEQPDVRRARQREPREVVRAATARGCVSSPRDTGAAQDVADLGIHELGAHSLPACATT